MIGQGKNLRDLRDYFIRKTFYPEKLFMREENYESIFNSSMLGHLKPTGPLKKSES